MTYGGAALVLPGQEFCTLLVRQPENHVYSLDVDDTHLFEELASRRASLFTPQALSAYGQGQLSFADVETRLSRQSFSYLLKEREALAKVVTDTVTRAIRVESEHRNARNGSQPTLHSAADDVIRVAFAYLAARILDDKGFFGEDSIPEYDPEKLLTRAVDRVNGFLKETRNTVLSNLSDQTQQVLAKHLGVDVTFALMDYLHIGQIYEQMTGLLPAQHSADLHTPGQHSASIAGQLQRHYTPDPIAIRLFEHLPIERLRPEHRVIFDPAAGSGTLLLAATRRLRTG